MHPRSASWCGSGTDVITGPCDSRVARVRSAIRSFIGRPGATLRVGSASGSATSTVGRPPSAPSSAARQGTAKSRILEGTAQARNGGLVARPGSDRSRGWGWRMRCDNRGVIEAAVRAAAVPPFHAMAMSREAARSRPRDDGSCTSRSASRRRRCRGSPGRPSAPTSTSRSATRTPRGCTSLRRRLAERYEGVDAEPGHGGGRSVGGFHARVPHACSNAGDRVGVLEPGYPCYRNTLLALGMTPVADPGRARHPVGADAGASRPGRRARRTGTGVTVEPDRHGPERNDALADVTGDVPRHGASP